MTALSDFLCGFLMGSADVVPGVSGGTVALVLGIYERLVSSIHVGAAAVGNMLIARGTAARRRAGEVEWWFLIWILVGIIAAVFTLAAVIDHFLEEQPQNTAAVFFGLVTGSILIAWRLVRGWDATRIAVCTAVALAAFLLLGLRNEEVAKPATLLFLGAGAIAIVAMILPGISGSFILLMLGMYQPVLDAVTERSITLIGVFGLGAAVGLALFSTILNRLLRDHHDTVMAALIGLMIGSLRVLWPWPDGTDTARLAAPTELLIPLILAAAGFLVVAVLGRIGRDAHAG